MNDGKKRTYIAIDLKSFFASAECVSRGLDPLNTNLVVADISRTEKTICLAITPSLKQYGLGGRARLFEVVQKINAVNSMRLKENKKYRFQGSSFFDNELQLNKYLKIDYIIAPPRMAFYMKISSLIYSIYLSFVSPSDIQSYSIDEVFIDATDYLKIYNCTAEEFATMMIKKVLDLTGITATCGIGPNLYLAKIAMDITAKHIKADKNGVRIALLDELSYREQLWEHLPLSDFWSFGEGIINRLSKLRLFTMGDIALYSLKNEKRLFNEFGINAELIIDHAWGYEPCKLNDIKNYKPKNTSLSRGQVLSEPYSVLKARIILEEMIDDLVLTITDKNLVCKGVSLYVGYDVKSLEKNDNNYIGRLVVNRYGQKLPYPVNVSKQFDNFTLSMFKIKSRILSLYDNNVDKALLVRRMTIAFNGLTNKDDDRATSVQYLLFENENQNPYEASLQTEINKMKKKFGKNVLLKGISYTDGATARERNKTIGGHKA